MLGALERLDDHTRKAVDRIVDGTRGGRALRLNLMISYSGREELLCAIRALARDTAAGQIDPESIDESALEERLYTAGLPDPDLLIRTSGEFRISNFMLWQSAYAELVFLEEHWPDVDRRSLWRAVEIYASRDRRYGGAIDATQT